jgi:hypothetical protein
MTSIMRVSPEFEDYVRKIYTKSNETIRKYKKKGRVSLSDITRSIAADHKEYTEIKKRKGINFKPFK